MDLMFFALNIVNNVKDLIEKNNDHFSLTQVEQFRNLFNNMIDVLIAPIPQVNEIEPSILQEMKRIGENIDNTILSMTGKTYPQAFTPFSSILRSQTMLPSSREYNILPVFDPITFGNETSTTTTTPRLQTVSSTLSSTLRPLSPSLPLLPELSSRIIEPAIISSSPISPLSSLSPNLGSERFSPPHISTSNIFKFTPTNIIDISKGTGVDQNVIQPLIPQPDSPPSKRGPGRPRNDPNVIITCSKCKTTRSPEFRFKTTNPLCNACGIQLYKQINKEKEMKGQFSISTLVNSDIPDQPPQSTSKNKKKPPHPYNRPTTRGKHYKK